MSDRLTRFSQQDPTAVADLYAEFGGAVFTVAMSILNDRHLAADATQETFIKAWRGAPSFDPARDFAPWVYAIARRASIDILRRRRETLADDLEIADDPGEMERVWETFQVRHAIDRLPDDERDVVRLTHLAGFTHAETAEKLDIPVGTVKSRSHRAHGRLAVLLGHLVGEENRWTSVDRIEDTTDEI